MSSSPRLGVATLAIALLIAAGACDSEGAAGAGPRRVQIVASFYPMAFAARAVGGARVHVDSLTPAGVEPHDLELSADQAQALYEADLVVYVGGGFQPAVEDTVSQLDGSARFDVLEVPKDVLVSEENQSEVDPHIWLDPKIMASIADELGSRLADLDAAGARDYERRGDELIGELGRLDRDYSAGLSECRSHEFVTSHAAFGYLADRYGLEQVAISGVDPEGEPDPGRLAEIANFVGERDVSTIFFEELAPPDIAETLARETGASVEVLSPLESEPDHGDYLTAMRANLTKLREALGCD